MTDHRLFSQAGYKAQSSARLITSNNQLPNQSDMINEVFYPGGVKIRLKPMKILKVLWQHQLVKLSREIKTQKYNKSKEQEESDRQQVTMNDHQNSRPSSSINLWLASLCPHGSHYSKKALRFFTSGAFWPRPCVLSVEFCLAALLISL